MASTGPAYPPRPGDQSGTNAIGSMIIGTSPIGDIRPFDVWTTVMSQYANSPRLMALVTNFQDDIDQTKNFDEFFDFIWNVDTAQGIGLDIWGRIVAVNRVLTIGIGPPFFGFDEGNAAADYTGFNDGPFYSGQKASGNFILTDDGFRVLILAKAFSNICNASIPSTNFILRYLFGSSGRCYCTDGLDMTMTYTFEFAPTPVQVSILTNSGVFPRPSGVTYTLVKP